jgi:hypothetical protein
MVGADMSGKTQIAKELSRQTGIPYYKASSEHKTFLKQEGDFVNQLRYGDPKFVDVIRQLNASIIMDRAWPCEWVYAPLLGRETDWNALEAVDEMFASLGSKVIICERSSYANITDDLDPKLNSTRLEQIASRYQLFKMWTLCDSYTLNVDSEDLENQISELRKFLNI